MKSVRFALSWLLAICLTISQTGCATGSRRAKVPNDPISKTEALEREVAEAVEIQRSKQLAPDQLDKWLRVVSMALDAGEPEYARKVLVEVTSMFGSLVAEKDFSEREHAALQTVGGKEKEKYFLGDPYEQMLAFLYLGILDFQAGQYDLARVSFRNASLADAGSSVEGYNADCYLAMLLEGVASLRMGEQTAADEAFHFAERAFMFRQNMQAIQHAIYTGVTVMRPDDSSPKDLERLDRLMPVVFENLPPVLSVNDDPVQAVKAVFEAAKGSLDNPEKKSAADAFLDACERSDRKGQAIELVETLEAEALTNLDSEVLTLLQVYRNEFRALEAVCRDPATNTFILHQIGRAPAKVRGGKYGEVIQFYAYPSQIQRVLYTVSNSESGTARLITAMAIPGESTDYQATTRGGRQMDHILKGRAEFRDNMNVVSGLAMGAVPVAMFAGAMAAATIVTTTTTTVTYTVSSTGAVSATTTTTTTSAPAGAAAATPFLIAAAAALAVYKGTKMIADATHPEGDIRGWHELPSQILFTCGFLEPGNYELGVECFDLLAQPVPEQSVRTPLEVSPGKPVLLLTGRIWN